MTQLGESLAIGVIDESDANCPFDHSTAEPPKLKNVFDGDAKVLEDNMAKGIGSNLRSAAETTKTLCPNYDKKHAFYDGKEEDDWPVKIKWKDPKSDKFNIHRYPVTCAAHHIIPAHETLEEATALKKYMKRKSDKGKCYSNVGYDVNGAHNGVFLPGNYGVTSVGMSRSLWSSAPSAMNDDDDAQPSADGENSVHRQARTPKHADSKMLTGYRHEVNADNRKWQYVLQSMKMAPGQFHDRHKDYSDKVIEILEKISNEYILREENLGCAKCKEKFKKAAVDGIPTPFALVDRLNSVSARLATYLNGTVWNMELYTSKWGLAYMRAVKAKQLKLF